MVQDGPGMSGRSFLDDLPDVQFLNCLKKSGTVRDDPGRGQDLGRSVVGAGSRFGTVPASSVTAP